jgi:hypothetical protein
MASARAGNSLMSVPVLTVYMVLWPLS